MTSSDHFSTVDVHGVMTTITEVYGQVSTVDVHGVTTTITGVCGQVSTVDVHDVITTITGGVCLCVCLSVCLSVCVVVYLSCLCFLTGRGFRMGRSRLVTYVVVVETVIKTHHIPKHIDSTILHKNGRKNIVKA